MKRHFLLALAFAALAAAPAAGAPDTIRIAVIHTNDVHGWIYARPATWYKADPKRMVGGFAALANFVKAERDPKLLLDGGDWFQGTPEAYFSSGTAMIECMNVLGYDAVELGNHDFDFGLGQLERLARASKAPVLGSNVYQEKDGERPSFITPMLLKDVGIFGLLTTNMAGLAFPENYRGLRFRREVDEARDMVRQLKAQGATVIIAVSHMGFMDPKMNPFEDDKFLAGEVPGIDLIVGAHTHTRLSPAVRDPRNGTLITQAGNTLSQVGRAELEVDRATGKVVRSTDALVDLWVDRWGEDPDVEKIARRYKDDADRIMNVVVATAAETIANARAGEEPLGDWMTDCERDWARTDLAFHNHGGIRATIDAGPVTLREIFDAMPFDNRMATLTLTGAQVRATFEQGVSGKAGMMQVSGASMRYKPDAERGKRVQAVLVGGKPVKDDALYTVATTDFLVHRGDGYNELGHGRDMKVTPTLLRDVLIGCARREGTLRPGLGGRIVKEP